MDSIGPFVTGQLAAWEVPGCAVAAVRDGEVVLAGGWGRRDLEAGLPVTPGTLFAIGSATKAFTASIVGALVEDGLLEWDRPIRDYLPDVRLHDPVVSDRLTVVDLLCHRSGLPRHDLTWVSHPDVSRAELVRRLRFLPLSRDLRQEFQYCNLGYLVAGHSWRCSPARPGRSACGRACWHRWGWTARTCHPATCRPTRTMPAPTSAATARS
jgi:CubicO group peptidase (beta-lactamase class C family)